ncbi:response regulator [Desulfobacterales bacterium HSG17]|nr:response regulator [Desulfobacterales bacterium HSG17]
MHSNTPESHPLRDVILIVDDNPRNLFSMKKVLSSKNREIVTAESGQAALMFLMKHQVSLIIMDVQMPEMDGFETVQFILQDQRHAEVPILFITAFYRSEDYVKYGFDAGGYDYISKPVDAELLSSKVNVFLKMKRRQKESENICRQLSRHADELRQKNRYLTDILSSMSHGLIMADTKARIKTVNRAALFLLGYNEKEVTGKNVSHIFEDGDLMIRDNFSHKEKIAVTHDGEKIPVIISASVMRDEAGNNCGTVLVIRGK